MTQHGRQSSVIVPDAGLVEKATQCCTTFEQEAYAVCSQLAHAAEFEDCAGFEARFQQAKQYEHLQGDLLGVIP